jgi:hypothetical protein
MSAYKLGRVAVTGAVFACSLALSAPSLAADAYASFDGTNGSGGFTYGSTDGSAFTPFTNNTNCVLPSSVCLQRSSPSANGDLLPGVYKNSGPAFVAGTVNVPATSLVLHPGPANNGTSANLESVYVAFTAAAAGVYNYTATFNAVDTSPSGVGISSFTLAGVTPLASLSSVSTTFSTTGTVTLAANEVFGFIIDKGSFYFNDSTSMAFSISAVPEPATWAMMIGGFGVAGIALRRRRRVAVRFA